MPCFSRGWGSLVLMLALWLVCGAGHSFGQTYRIDSYSGQTVSATSGNFYDSGGSGGSYNSSETYTVTFNSGTSDKIRFAFSSFSTESGFDYLYIYDGPSTASAQISGSPFNGTTSPGTITSTTNCLTFKFTSDSSVTASGWAAAISTVAASDYGDYSGFGSASATASTSLYLGTNATDIEGSNPANSAATGDNNSGTNDEDLTQPSMTAGATSSLTVPVFNNTGSTAYLSIWIDYNNNGVVTDANEKVVNNLSVSSNSSVQNLVLSVAVPTSATTGTPLGMRYRLDSTTNVASTGIGGLGEVEDYLITISAPTLDYGDFSGFGNAASTANSNLRLGLLVDAEGSPTKNSTATGDDTTGSDDEDGITLPSFLTAGLAGSFTGTVTNNTGSTAYLNAWVDFNNNGSLNDAGEQIATNMAIPTGVTNTVGQLNFTVPSNATTTTVGVRFRLTSTSSPGPTGTSGVGEVEDYVIAIQPAMSIGNLVWADTNNNGVKDASESGLSGVTVQLYTPGADNTVNTADDTLVGTTTTSATGAYLFSGLPSGKYFVKVTPPTGYPMTSGTPVTTDNDVDNNNDGAQPGGVGTALYSPIITLTPNGESVADGDTDANTNLTVDFGLFTGFTVGNLVFNDANNNGVQDAGESGISGLTVELLNSAGASFSPAVTTTTNASGNYGFTVYTAGTYKVKVTPNATYPVGSSVVGTDNGTDSVNDGTQSGTQGTASTSFAFTLTPGAEPGGTGSTNVENTVDFGFLACPTIILSPSSLPSAVMATAYSQATAFSATGGTAPYSWSVSGLPVGMSWDSVNLKFTGTPLFTGSSSVSMTVTDAKGCTASQTVAFLVCSTPSPKPDSLSAATLGASYSATLSATEPGFDLQQAFSSTQIGTLANADALLSGTNRTSNWTGAGAVVNFVSSGGGDGNFTGTVFPAGAGDDFAVRATGVITIPTAGAWSFGINSDDGCRLKIDGTAVITTDAQRSAADSYGTITLTAGTHTIDAVFFERAGGESFELFAASGTRSSFSTAFKLIGSSGGLAVVRSAPTYTWAVTSGSLPPGLALNASTGVISGIANTAGSYTFTVSATDTTGCVGTKSYTMTAACPTLTMTPAAGALATGTVGTAYSQALGSSGSFGTLAWAVSSGTLPAGLSLNSATGAISGTPTAPTSGTSGTSISVTALDQYGCFVTQAYTLKICPVLSFSPATLTTPTVGTAYSQAVSASNGTAPYTYAVTTGVLPSGLTMSSAGLISGTPTNTTSQTFTVTATDANGCPGTKSYTLAATCPALAITPATLPTGTVSSAYSQTLGVSGGTSPYAWSITSGTLPAGLSLASGTGVISGTPTASNGAGVSVTFKATDTYGCAGTLAYTFKICPVITVTPATLTTGTVGSVYSASMSSSGGASPITYAVTSGTLPAGLSMSSGGAISGTPTGSNGAGVSFTVTATDVNGCPGSVVSTLKICPVISLSPTTLAVPTVGTAYTQSITAANGASPYTYAVTSGSLPTGLSLSSGGVFSGTPTNTVSQTFTVTATDVNGCPGSRSYTLAPVCPTITITPATVGVGTVSAAYSQTLTASNGTAPYTWSLTSGTLPAGLSLAAGTGIISGTPTVSNGTGVPLTFGVVDTYGCSASISYTMKICPLITVTPAALAAGTVGTAYSASVSASGGASPITYALTSGTLPAGLSFNTSTGAISGTPTTANGAGVSLTFTATDVNGCTGTVVSLLKICPVLGFSPTTLATPVVGTAYTPSITAGNGVSPYTFSITSGSLPTGLSLSSAGVFSGTPTNTTSQTFTVRAVDANGCPGTITYTLAPVCPTLGFSPSSLPSGTVGSAYSQTLTASNGTSPYTWTLTSGTLPAGISLSSAGALTGTPTATNGAGVSVTFQAVDTYGCSNSITYTFKICPVITLSPTSLPTPVVGTPYSQTISASGGASPYTYSRISGSLPAGLSLNASTGVLSGTPTNTTSRTFNLQGLDANGCAGTRSYTLAPVCPTISLSPGTVPTGTVGSAYSQTLTASGGTSPYTWTVNSGTLPAGLSLSSGGVLSGTPTASNGAGVSVTLKAADLYNCSATIVYTIKICPVLVLGPATLPQGTVGSTYSSAVTASNGASPYTWSITAGTLPAGLSFNTSTGAVTGTPTTANGTGTVITFKATDLNNCPGSFNSTLQICPVITLAPAAFTTPIIGTPTSQTVTASGGTGPYTYAITAGTLPAGLSLSSAGVLSGTASSTVSQTFDVTATDANGCPATRTYTVAPVCPTVTLNPASLPYGTAGSAYSQTLSNTGGNPPYTWAVQSGTLPAGLNLSTGGVLSGTPATSNGAGTSITFAATDIYGCVVTITYNLKICPVITVSPAVLPYGTVGVAYSSPVTQSGGAPPATFAVTGGTLPAGLSLDSGGLISGTPTTSNGAGVTVTFTATDVNGCPGTVDSLFKICPVITTAPVTASTPVVGFSYSQTLTASNGAAPYTWTVVSGTLPNGLSLSSSGVISGIATSTATQTFTVQAADVNGCPAVRTYTITPVCPTVLIAPATVPFGTVGTPYSQTLTASGGTAPYTFSIQSGTLPAGLTLDSSGLISGTPTASNGAGVTVQFKATDVYGCSGTFNFFGTQNYTVKVCPVITLSPSSPLPTATLGVAYSQTLTASGGAGPYTWSVTSGSLPNGMTMSSGGVISGTPTVVASFNFTAQAVDVNGCPGTQAYALPVQCPPIFIAPPTLPVGTLGVGYNQTLSASGGTSPYSWAVTGGTLPAGLNLSSAGVISGTPTATNGAGVNVTFTATDSNLNHCQGVQAYNFKICPVISLSPATLPPLTVGAAYSQTVTASGGAGPYVFSLFNGTLPPWATFDAHTGVISGTPTNTTSYTFVLQAVDVNGCPGLLSYTVAPACPVVSVSPAGLPAATVGTPYSATISGGGGSAPYTYAVSGGALPSWAVLNTSTGVISGTPSGTASATFTITASDSYVCQGSRTYNLTPVCPAISITPATLPVGTVGTVYSGVATASGGTAPYTYTITGGTFPAGLSISAATGQISGTPSAPTSGATGTALTIRATDTYGCQASQVMNLKICPVISFTPASLAAGTVGTAYTQAVTASGGAAPYVYSISSGTLPPGLSMDGAGNITGTPTTQVSSNITVSVVDANGCPGSQAYTLAVSCPVITISPATLPQATQGTPFSGSLTASGGTAPYNWTVTSGTLPTGISMTSAGVFSGTPSASNGAGVSVTFQASDSYGCLATKTYAFKVCPVISFLQNSLPSGTVGVAYNQQVSALNGAPPFSYAITSGTLPGGLTLNGGTGVISGTPTASNGAGTSITMQAVDANSCAGAKNYILKICPVISLTPSSLPAPVVGSSYNQTLSATGGAAPYSYSVTNGSLPAWATLNTSTGVISGTPNSTTGSSFTITAIDVNGCPGTQTYNFTPACPTITVLPGSLPSGTIGVSYTQAFTATGGSSPYVWSLVSGSLPAGLSLSSGGVLTGTPTATNGAGVSITVRATDNLSCSSTRTVTVKICPVITVGPSSLAPFVVGAAYSQTVTGSGGTAPYTFSVSSGTLPSWATLNASTGVISGTPDNTSTAAFSITATDANGCSGVRSYTMALLTLKVGNLVWSDTNGNGVKDAGENGVAGLKLELWSAGPNGTEENGGGDDVKIAADVTTDTSGSYLFVGVPAGSNYYVRIPVLPPTNAVTSANPVNADNGVDNDNNGLQPGGPGTPIRSPLFAIAPFSEPDAAVDGDDTNGNLTIDFGLAPTISVGNLVFKDVDNSGTYDSAVDSPLDGVTVQLYAQGSDPLSTPPVTSTVTANGGQYLFSVKAGNYFVYVPASQFYSTGLLYNMKPARGRTDNTVPNIDDSGDQNALATSKPIATGVRTGVFSLASGVMPTAASGETGYQANTDSSFDADANLTVDLGFYPVPVNNAPLAGHVLRDLSGLGDPDAATTAIAGVEVILYQDINGNGVLDASEMTAVATTVTDAGGAYAFEDLAPGDYLVVQSILPGAEATFDSDGGDADITAITIDGDPVVDVNFLQALSPDTFSQWQQLHAGANDGATDNPDGDLSNNLLEYALATESGNGADKRRFWLAANAAGSADAVIVRAINGHKDITYRLEGSSDLATWTAITTTPNTLAGADGMETLRYPNITSAFVRLKVLLDADHNGTPEATATTSVQGWSRRTFAIGSQTFSMPLMKSEVYAGPAAAVTGSVLASGSAYFAETVSGAQEGARFEVDEAKSTASSLAWQGVAPAADARIALRAHWTLRELFPVTLFHAGSSSSNADRVMFFNGTGYDVRWLMARPTGNRWVRDGDATLADAGGTVVGSLDGVMVAVRTAPVSVTYAGEVRSWKIDATLHSGAQLVGTGYPLVLSPAARAMNPAAGFANGDSFRLWLGDASATAAYSSYLNSNGTWTAEDGHDAGNDKLFTAFHAAWMVSTAGTTTWSPPVPWQP